MEITKTEHEIRGDYKFIREITQDYFVRDNGEEVKLGVPHRHPQHVPGTLVEGTYVKTSKTDVSADVKALATHFHTADVHTAYEAALVAQAAEAAL